MTKKELIEALKDHPDDIPICTFNSQDGCTIVHKLECVQQAIIYDYLSPNLDKYTKYPEILILSE